MEGRARLGSPGRRGRACRQAGGQAARRSARRRAACAGRRGSVPATAVADAIRGRCGRVVDRGRRHGSRLGRGHHAPGRGVARASWYCGRGWEGGGCGNSRDGGRDALQLDLDVRERTRRQDGVKRASSAARRLLPATINAGRRQPRQKGLCGLFDRDRQWKSAPARLLTCAYTGTAAREHTHSQGPRVASAGGRRPVARPPPSLAHRLRHRLLRGVCRTASRGGVWCRSAGSGPAVADRTLSVRSWPDTP